MLKETDEEYLETIAEKYKEYLLDYPGTFDESVFTTSTKQGSVSYSSITYISQCILFSNSFHQAAILSLYGITPKNPWENINPTEPTSKES